jgi:hypothetical protein
MTLFLRRFFGALVFDASAFEDVEADRAAMLQSLAVVALAAMAGGIGAIGVGMTGVTGWLVGVAAVLGGWLVWITALAVIGTNVFREPQTRSGFAELVRTMGFAMAPGVFLAFAAMRAAAPIVVTIVAVWIVASTVIAMRQALDYRSTARAIAVCIVGWLLAVDVIAAVVVVFTRTVH